MSRLHMLLGRMTVSFGLLENYVHSIAYKLLDPNNEAKGHLIFDNWDSVSAKVDIAIALVEMEVRPELSRDLISTLRHVKVLAITRNRYIHDMWWAETEMPMKIQTMRTNGEWDLAETPFSEIEAFVKDVEATETSLKMFQALVVLGAASRDKSSPHSPNPDSTRN